MSTPPAAPAPLPQLSMRFTAFEKLAERCAVPAGYELWSMTLNDQPAYVEIMNSNAQLGAWTPERVRELFTGAENKMVLEGSYIIVPSSQASQASHAAAVT